MKRRESARLVDVGGYGMRLLFSARVRQVVGALVVGSLVFLVGCLTPTDRWLVENLTPEEKAALLVDRSLAAYQSMVDSDRLEGLASVRATLDLALVTHPGDPRATEAQRKLNAFVEKRQSEARARVQTLVAKPALTDREKFTLVVLVRQLEQLAVPGVEIAALTSQAAPIRAEVIQTLLSDLATAERAPTQGPNAVKSIKAVASVIQDLSAVDPQLPEVQAARARLETRVDAVTKADFDLAAQSLRSRDYPATLKTLGRIDQAFDAAGVPSVSQVVELRYQTQYAWAQALFTAKSYAEASSRVADALSLRATPEAAALREKISQAAAFRDWDAEYDALDKQIEGLVRSGDLQTAWNLVITGAARLKKDATKARIEARRKAVLDAVHALYETGVKAYNEEDYATAKAAFDTVAAIEPGWKLTKSYQDKARAKAQFLGGNP